MTILITGATGLVGRGLTQHLLDQGAEVRVITRRPHRVLEAFDSNRLSAFEWHPRTEPLLPEALEGVERVVHLMGEPLYGPATREACRRIAESRRIAATRLADALGRHRVHLIVASSALVYGFGAGPPLSEFTSELPRTRNRLVRALRAAEAMAAEQVGANGSTVTSVRFGMVIAPGGFIEPLRQLHAAGFTWSVPHPDSPNPTVVPAIDLEDAVTLLGWLARARRVSGPVNAVAPEPLRSGDLKALLEEAVPRRVRIPLPRLVLRRYIGTLADVVYGRQLVAPERLVKEAGFEFGHPHPNDSVHAVLARQAEAEAEARPAARKRGSLFGGVLQRGSARS
jgi:NAD dependent epimerase/dehydratase family enzyme